jgi:hypothetical protein
VRVGRHGKMQIARRGQRERALQHDLPRRGGEEVCAAHHVGDALLGVVHHDRELVREEPVAPPQHEIAHLARDVLPDAALHPILELDAAGRHAQAPGARLVGGDGAVAARARIHRPLDAGEARVRHFAP